MNSGITKRTQSRPRDRATAGRALACLLATAWIVLAVVAPVLAAPLYDVTEDPARRSAIDGAHRQMAACAAFFLITAEGIPPTAANRPALKRLEAVGDTLAGHMLRLKSESVTRARVEAERQYLMLVMGGGFDGYPRLREAFGAPCEAIAADPDGHVRRWLGEDASGGAEER